MIRWTSRNHQPGWRTCDQSSSHKLAAVMSFCAIFSFIIVFFILFFRHRYMPFYTKHSFHFVAGTLNFNLNMTYSYIDKSGFILHNVQTTRWQGFWCPQGQSAQTAKKNYLDFWTRTNILQKTRLGFQDGEKEEREQEEGLKEEEGVWVRDSSRLNPCQGSVK